jgi:nucleoside-diphosphate-sugar epimerase
MIHRYRYGTTKAMAELLINDYSRKGFIDGRGARLPTVIVRPGKPNGASTSCYSGVIREPLDGVDVCPPCHRAVTTTTLQSCDPPSILHSPPLFVKS